MAISQVRANVNGTWYTLTLNSGTGKYEASITAPGATSYNQSGGYYNVTVEATNTAGTKGTADGSTMNGLRLVVKERVSPVITILSPTSGAYVTNSKQPVVFNIVDEAGGSGIDLNTLVVKQGGTAVASGTLTTTPITNGYSVTYTPASALSDGSHTVTVNVSDHDGNSATQKSTTYTVDTVPPTLNVTSPTDGFITAAASLNIVGKTNDETSSPVTVTINLNGTDQGSVTVGSDGTFSKSVTLTEGSNTILVTATDAAGKTSSVTRTVTLDTSVPKVVSSSITPNPVDAGTTMIISVEVTG